MSELVLDRETQSVAAPGAITDARQTLSFDGNALPWVPKSAAVPDALAARLAKAASGEGSDDGFYARCLEARLKEPNTRRLLDDAKPQEHRHSLNKALTASKYLPEGAHRRVQVVAAEAPGFGLAALEREDAERNAAPRGALAQTASAYRLTKRFGASLVAAVVVAGAASIVAPFTITALIFLGVFGWNAARHHSTADKKAEKKEQAAAKAKARDERGEVARQHSQEVLAKAAASVHAYVDLRICVWGQRSDREVLDAVLEASAEGFDFLATNHQELEWVECSPAAITSNLLRSDRDDYSLVLTPHELAAVARTADKFVAAEGVDVQQGSLELPPPNEDFEIIEHPLDNPKGLIPIGIVRPHSDNAKIYGLPAEALDTDMLVAGKAGMGKSEAMKWHILGCAKAGYPIIVIDPHGKLADEALQMLLTYCPERRNDIISLNLAELDWAPAVNPLDVSTPEEVGYAVEGIMAQIGDQLGFGDNLPRGTKLVRLALKAMAGANLYIKDGAAKLRLAQLTDFFEDRAFREAVVWPFSRNLRYRDVLSEFQPESDELDPGLFEKEKEAEQSKIMQPIVRRFHDLMGKPVFPNIYGAAKNTLSFPELAAQRRIVIVNLARHKNVPADVGLFFASYIPFELFRGVSTFSRETDPVTGEEIGGPGLRLFIDEAASVCHPQVTIAIGAEFRKNGFGQILGFQDVHKFHGDVQDGLLNNTGTILALNAGVKASAPIARELAPTGPIGAADIAAQDRYRAYSRVSGPGGPSPFSVALLPPAEDYDEWWQLATPEQRAERVAWVRQQVAEVSDRSHTLICNPASAIAADYELVAEDGVMRPLMTAHSVRALREAAKEVEAPKSAPRPTRTRTTDALRDVGGASVQPAVVAPAQSASPKPASVRSTPSANGDDAPSTDERRERLRAWAAAGPSSDEEWETLTQEPVGGERT